MGSRFDDLIYWTSLLQLQLIITADTLNSFWITIAHCSLNLRLVFSLSNSGSSLIPGNQFRVFHDPVQTADRTTCLTIPMLFCLSVATVIRCCGKNVYLAVAWQQTSLLCFSDCALPAYVTISTTAYPSSILSVALVRKRTILTERPPLVG
jgi:hypothetical protein